MIKEISIPGSDGAVVECTAYMNNINVIVLDSICGAGAKALDAKLNVHKITCFV